jgi:hypothetical protein
MEITQEYNVDCASRRMVIVMGEIGICLKGEVGQFSSILLGTVLYWLRVSFLLSLASKCTLVSRGSRFAAYTLNCLQGSYVTHPQLLYSTVLYISTGCTGGGRTTETSPETFICS